ncbi:hypothetical protein ACFYYH_19160 [Streptomyces sp. NPDC002018]|uniref:hypothetical protein n=1 Tax=Streptomyces sp. NPDC002018 TaxID=3364629 RepID=UPI0036A2B58F
MTSQNPEKNPSRKQRLQEKQRRQLAVVDTIDKAEAKLRKAEAELAEAVAEAVEVFGGELSAADELGLSVDTIRGFLSLAEGGAAGTEAAEEADEGGESVESAAAGRPAKAGTKAKTEGKTEGKEDTPAADAAEPEPVPA